jgi:hypothetical protein
MSKNLKAKGAHQGPLVYIIVLNYNGKELLRDCLGSLLKVDYPNFKILVTDNGSTDGSLEMIQKEFACPEVLVWENGANLGFAAGNNAGIKQALAQGADYVLLLNNDTLVEPDFLTELIKVGEKSSVAGILCPLILEGDRESVWFSGGWVDWWRMKSHHRRDQLKGGPRRSEIITGCAMLIKDRVVEQVGFLDEDYFLYWEDSDFSLRARRKNWKLLVVPKSKIYHLEVSETVNKNKLYWLVLSGWIFFKKNTPWYFRPWVGFYSALRRTKNWWDRKKGGGELAEAVNKAYQDFKNNERKSI